MSGSYYNSLLACIPEEYIDALRKAVNKIYDEDIDESWVPVFQKYEDELMVALYHLRMFAIKHKGSSIYPIKSEIFSVFKYVKFEDVKVIIMGQDPYHLTDSEGKPFACGIAFSTHKGQQVPHSLKNIFAVITKQHSTPINMRVLDPPDGDIRGWCEQGVLLMNTSLTVMEKVPGSMMGGVNDVWTSFMGCIFNHIAANNKHVVVMAWGRPAQDFVQTQVIGNTKGVKSMYKLTHAHPSRLENFIYCDHFTVCNEYLKNNKIEEIDWYRTHLKEE